MNEKPQRIQLKRTKGFVLQQVSLALNGLPAVNCARPGKWGNIFKVGGVGFRRPSEAVLVRDAQHAVDLFKDRIVFHAQHNPTYLQQLKQLKGKNLACWCKLNDPCHCDVLLEFANNEVRE